MNKHRILWAEDKTLYYLENNKIKSEHNPALKPFSYLDEMHEFLRFLQSLGYTIQNPRARGILDKTLGNTWDDLVREVKKRVALIERRKRKNPVKKPNSEWKDLDERFSGYVIGLDAKYFRTFPTGFAVRILMRSAPIDEIKSFVKGKQKEILRWCMEEIKTKKQKQIGDLKFYRPTEMIMLQSSEVEVIFEAKGGGTAGEE